MSRVFTGVVSFPLSFLDISIFQERSLQEGFWNGRLLRKRRLGPSFRRSVKSPVGRRLLCRRPRVGSGSHRRVGSGTNYYSIVRSTPELTYSEPKIVFGTDSSFDWSPYWLTPYGVYSDCTSHLSLVFSYG